MSEATQTEMEVNVSTEPVLAPKPKAKTKAKAKKKAQPKAAVKAVARAAAKKPVKKTVKKAVKTVSTKLPGERTMPSKTSAYKKIEASFEPVIELNKMVTGSVESSYNLLMDSYQSYAKLGIDSLQSSLKVRTPEDMVSYFETQHAMAQKASDMMMSDAKTFSDMGIKFMNDVRALYESGMKTSVSAASEAMKAA